MKNSWQFLTLPNRLAYQTFLLLVSGLAGIGLLLMLIISQHDNLLRKHAPNSMLQLRLAKMANQESEPSKKFLEKLQQMRNPHLNIKIVNEAPTDIPSLKQDELLNSINHPFVIELKHHQWAIVKVNKNNSGPDIYLYWASIIMLLSAAVALCFWSIKRVCLPYSFIRNALMQLSQNVNAPISMPYQHADIENIANKITMIQNQLKKHLYSRTHILAAISHDLRTPITRLKLKTELLQDEKYKDRMLQDLDEVEYMLNSVLAFSKDFMQEEKPVHFNFSDLVEAVCDDMLDQNYAVKKNIINEITYYGRMSSLKRAIQNILDNAIKYGKENIEVHLLQQNEKIVLNISDHGPGIPEDKLTRIFEPFVRIDAARNHQIKGSGLGLSICKEIIDSHGGTIRAQNVMPCGLRVSVVL